MPATSTVWPCRVTLRTSGSPVRSPSSSGTDGRNRSRCTASTRDDDPGGRVEGHDAAGVDQGDPVGEALGLLHEVGDEDDRHAAGPDVLDELPGVAPGLRVEARRELVEDRDLGVADEGEGDREPLLLAARQLAELGLALVRQPEVGEQPLAVPRPRVERGIEVDGLPDAHLVRQLALLELDADDATELVAVALRVEAEDADRARVRRAQPADRLDGRGLARAVGAEDGEDLALLDREGHAVDGRAVAVALDEVGDFDDVHGPSLAATRSSRHRPAGSNPRPTRLTVRSTDRLVGLRHQPGANGRRQRRFGARHWVVRGCRCRRAHRTAGGRT